MKLSVCTSFANNIIVFLAFRSTLWACTRLFHQPINAPPYRIKSVCVLLTRHITAPRVKRQCSGRVLTISSDCNPFRCSFTRIENCREYFKAIYNMWVEFVVGSLTLTLTLSQSMWTTVPLSLMCFTFIEVENDARFMLYHGLPILFPQDLNKATHFFYACVNQAQHAN